MGMEHRDDQGPVEIAIIGDLTDNESDLTEKLLGVEPGAECTIYIDSPGGSPYTALSLMSIIRLRGMQVTGIVTGECSSAMLWPFAACTRRLVTPYSVLLFHPMKWQSEEHVGLAEAAEWARHFGHLEIEMDKLLAELFDVPVEQISRWISPGRYVTGAELAKSGLAELVPVAPLKSLVEPGEPSLRAPKKQNPPRQGRYSGSESVAGENGAPGSVQAGKPPRPAGQAQRKKR